MITFVVEDGTGLASATSYVSVEEADDIAVLNIHNSDAWLALPLDAKRNLLMYATRVLDARAVWQGSTATSVQSLAWPRTGTTDRYKNTLSSSAVPYAVRWATVEMAKHSLTEDKFAKTTPEQIVSEVKIDTVSIKFADPTETAISQYRTPPIVTDILIGLGSIRGGTKKVAFGRLVHT